MGPQDFAQSSAQGSEKKPNIVGTIVDDAVKKANPKDVGFFLKVISISVLIVALGVGISFIIRGSVNVSAEAKTKAEMKTLREDAAAFKNDVRALGSSGTTASSR